MDKILEKECIMANDFDYYLIERDNNCMSPLLMNDDKINSGGTMFLRNMKSIDTKTVVHLVFNPPIPPKPDMADYLFLQTRAVFSKKIYDVLKNIDIKDFQLIPAVIKNPEGKEYTDYWIANIYREFAFLDKDKSKFSRIDSSGCWKMIKSMVINEEEMSKVPLKERLMYISKESSAYIFCHKSIVDAIMAINPTGIKFTKVVDWRS
jgi:hypothetical protein